MVNLIFGHDRKVEVSLDLSHIQFFAPPPLARVRPRSSPWLAEKAPRSGEAGLPGPAPDPGILALLQLAGISGEGYRTAVLQRRLPACLRALRAGSTTDALQQARLRPDGRRSVANSFLLGVTGFFRDPGVFAFLRHTVLPGLLSSRPNLRVLSLGCSTGEELYSLAFLLHELGALAGSELVGLDARLDAVEDASAGLYPVAELEAVPAQFHNLFRPSGRKLEIVPEVRRPVSFLVRDILLEPIPPGSWDLVMFRNVAIYLSPAASERLWEGLAGGVAAGGILVTGKAERPPAEQPFRRLFPCVYSRK